MKTWYVWGIIIDEPIIISNYFEANKLKKSIEEYLIKR